MRLRYRYVSVEYAPKPAHGERMQRAGWTWMLPLPYTREEVWRPPTDVYETDGHIVIMMELAGVKEDDIEVTVFTDLLVVSGTRQDGIRPEKVVYHEMGINFGRFRSEVFLPIRVSPECIEARYENGFLYIWLLKSCEAWQPGDNS